jgi:hypothetical protein
MPATLLGTTNIMKTKVDRASVIKEPLLVGQRADK